MNMNRENYMLLKSNELNLMYGFHYFSRCQTYISPLSNLSLCPSSQKSVHCGGCGGPPPLARCSGVKVLSEK
jgi:hypothetical protein